MRKVIAICVIALLLCNIAVLNSMALTNNSSEDKIMTTMDKSLVSIKAEKEKYKWADQIEKDLIKGKIKNLSSYGVKDFDNIKDASDIVLPPSTPSQNIEKNTDYMATLVDHKQIAGYQYFGGNDKPSYTGRVYFRTSDVDLLYGSCQEIQVAHSWSCTFSGGVEQPGYENCVALSRNGNDVTFGIKAGQVCPSGWNYNTQRTLPGCAGHTFSIGVRPEHPAGYRNFNSVYFWVWDLTTNQKYEYTYNLPITEYIKTTDHALETYQDLPLSSDWIYAYNFYALDEDMYEVDLQNNLGWTEHPGDYIYRNEHSESYPSWHEGLLGQRKVHY